jgi:hypothetical protein
MADPKELTVETADAEHRLYEERLNKGEQWRALGIHPFGNGFSPTHGAGDIVRQRNARAECN